MSEISIKEQKKIFRTKIFETGLLVLAISFFVTEIINLIHWNLFNLIPDGSTKLNTEAAANIILEISGIVVCIFLYISVFIDERRSRFRSLFLGIIFLESFILFLDSLSWTFILKPEFNTLQIIINCLFSILGAFIFYLFWQTQIELMNLKPILKKPVKWLIWIVFGAYLTASILNVKFCFFYKIENSIYILSDYYWTEYIFPFIISAISLWYAFKIKIFWKIKLPYILMSVLPICVILLQIFAYSLSLMYISVLLAIFVLYINVQVDLGHKIEEFKNKVMISQIQPHFMYNTLTTIKALCRVEPELASKTIENFADYLRGNMDFASLETTIPLEKELKHTKIYTEIEALRFDNITFEFKIEDENFQVPALTIQPMVENAVRHGVRSRKDGHILIHTFSDENFHNIVIKDNGKGFDNKQFNGSRTHIGLLNTKLRVERLVNGKFEVESQPEKGVTITMRIPK